MIKRKRMNAQLHHMIATVLPPPLTTSYTTLSPMPNLQETILLILENHVRLVHTLS